MKGVIEVYSKINLENYKIVECDRCEHGVIYSHGAFGESESYTCTACSGTMLRVKRK